VIRPLRPDEVEEAVALWERSRWDALPWLEARLRYSHEDNLEFFRDVVMQQNTVWVAEVHGGLAGFLALSPGKVELLFVEPELQRSGVGSSLLEHAKLLQPDGLALFTHQRNMRAIEFYERRRFSAIAFGVSPKPENEPDVQYAWEGSGEGKS